MPKHTLESDFRSNGGGGGGGGLTSKGVSNQVGAFLNFPPPFFFSANWVDG